MEEIKRHGTRCRDERGWLRLTIRGGVDLILPNGMKREVDLLELRG